MTELSAKEYVEFDDRLREVEAQVELFKEFLTQQIEINKQVLEKLELLNGLCSKDK